MDRSGQHLHSLFAGIDEERPKTFTIEVSAHSTLSALKALEKAVEGLKMRHLHFHHENSEYKNVQSVKATFRYSCYHAEMNSVTRDFLTVSSLVSYSGYLKDIQYWRHIAGQLREHSIF